jgi:hypothetical protein
VTGPIPVDRTAVGRLPQSAVGFGVDGDAVTDRFLSSPRVTDSHGYEPTRPENVLSIDPDLLSDYRTE